MSEWRDVGQVLLGSWPSQVASWGREAIAAYVAELKGRGLTPDRVIVALRSSESKFPPAASEIAAAVRVDPSLPTFDEAWLLIERAIVRTQTPSGTFDSPGDMAKVHNDAVLAALECHHPAIRSFAERQGLDRLRTVQVDDSQWGDKTRRELREAWERHLEAIDGREVAALASGRPDGLKQLDPLTSLGLKPPRQIEAS